MDLTSLNFWKASRDEYSFAGDWMKAAAAHIRAPKCRWQLFSLALLCLMVPALLQRFISNLKTIPRISQLTNADVQSQPPGKLVAVDPRVLVQEFSCNESLKEFLTPINPPKPAPERGAHGKNCLNILLIIIFNSALYDHAPFLREMYEPGFTKVVMYGPVENRTSEVIASPRQDGKDSYMSGSFFHLTIAQAMVEYPRYDGYVWMADDNYFNYKLFYSIFDPTKVWTPEYQTRRGEYIFDRNITKWLWDEDIFMPRVREAYDCLPRKYLDRSPERYGCAECVISITSDWGYVPLHMVEDFLYMTYAMRRVFIEIAIPTTLWLIPERKSDLRHLDPKYYTSLWGKQRDVDDILVTLSKIQPNLILFHPLKTYRKPSLAWRVIRLWRKWKKQNLDRKSKWRICQNADA